MGSAVSPVVSQLLPHRTHNTSILEVVDGVDSGYSHDHVSWSGSVVLLSPINYADIDAVSFSSDGLQRPGTGHRLEPIMEQVQEGFQSPREYLQMGIIITREQHEK